MLTINNTPSTPQFRDVDGIFIQSACFQLIFQHTLDFVVHCFFVRFREMGSHNIRCLSDFLNKRRTALCICCIVHSFFLQKSPTRIKSFCRQRDSATGSKRLLILSLQGEMLLFTFSLNSRLLWLQ